MEKVTVRTIEMTWDPQTRLAVMRFTQKTDAVGADAAALVETITRWVGGGEKPFALLGDGAGLGKLDAEYRATWGAFFREHRGNGFIAFYNMNPVIRIAAEMFRIGTGLRLKAFAGEAEARAWLKKEGIAA